jgi:hypothetical protein
MAERQGGQWNVATKGDEVYIERVTEDNERLFDDTLDPHEARQLGRLLKKFAEKLLDSNGSAESEDDTDSEDDDSGDTHDTDDTDKD